MNKSGCVISDKVLIRITMTNKTEKSNKVYFIATLQDISLGCDWRRDFGGHTWGTQHLATVKEWKASLERQMHDAGIKGRLTILSTPTFVFDTDAELTEVTG